MTLEQLFFELIRVAIGTSESLSYIPKPKEWQALYDMAKKQSLVGVCFAAIQRLPEDERPPELLYLTWMGMAAKTQQQCEEHRRVLKVVSEFLNGKGHRAIFMKGLTCAERYPEPLLRQCGDIDFVVKVEDFDDVMSALEEIAEVDHDLVHEHHGMAHIDSVQLEPHYKIHNYQNPKNDRMMRSMQQELLNGKDRCMMQIGDPSKYSGQLAEIEKFPLEFEGMFLVSHMVNHVYEEGLGLRQVMDFAFWIKDLPNHKDFDMDLYHEYLRKMHMTEAARIFTCICEKCLGIDRLIMGYAYTDKEKEFAERLLEDIMAVGNFARGAEKRPEAGWQAYWWTTKRAWRLGYLCPSEARWWPVSKFVRFFDKKLNSNKYRH